MKRSVLFLLFAFCFFVLPAAAQEAEYTITETELIRLEKILGNWEKSKRNQQLQVHNLKMRLSEALMKSEDLKSQLQTERETLKILRQSLAAYEKEVQDTLTLNETEIKNLKELNTKLEKEKAKLEKEKAKLEKAFLVLIFILILSILLAGINLFIKYKTKLLKVL